MSFYYGHFLNIFNYNLDRMSFQWTFIAACLYGEIAVIFIMLLPMISPQRWQQLFNSRPVLILKKHANYYASILLIIFLICLGDSIREMRKYSAPVDHDSSMRNNPGTIDHIHMKLFRAQRNFYIVGFTLFLGAVLRGLTVHILNEARLENRLTAALKQGESANRAAQDLLDRQGSSGSNSSANTDSDKCIPRAEALERELNQTKKTLKAKEDDFDALKKQAEATNAEYDRLSADYQELENKYNRITAEIDRPEEAGGDRKKAE